jgi:hypothetical protein
MQERQERSFLKKRTKKLFSVEARTSMLPTYKAKLTKVFCFFFSKKKSFHHRPTSPDDTELSAGLVIEVGVWGRPAQHAIA